MAASGTLFVLALCPIIFFVALELGSRGQPHKPTDSRPRQAVFPYVGVSLLPLVLLIASKLWSSSSSSAGKIKKLSLLAKLFQLVKRLAIVFLIVCYVGHNFFTFAYGNVNNEAFTTSLIVDVIASPDDFNKLVNIPADQFEVFSDPSVWASEDIIKGPHIDIKSVRDAQCGPRQFRRFMFHRILPESKASKVFDNRTMMGGLWTIVHGTDKAR